MTIAVLPDNLIDRIAAGEVVERPASVVKELVDNALDAGAAEISVLVDGSGPSLIRVNDDGEGVPFDEVALAFERHSTSKIRSEADLAEIATMGFRGEALPSIASVAVVEMVSRPASQESGCRYRVENGRKGSPVAAGCPVGTTVEVRDLFYHVPARLKFMKSPRTEIKYVSEVVNRVALAHPSVHFRLHHGGKRLADYAATTRLEDRVRQVFGDAGSELVPFSLTREHLRCTGFASRAPQSFGNTRYMVTFVNGRFVRDKLLTHAMLKAYDTLLMKGRYPATLLYLELPHGYVDVNVHPAKTEVRFRRQSELYETVLSAVRGGLRAAAGDGPLSPPRGASDPAGPHPRGARHPPPQASRRAFPWSLAVRPWPAALDSSPGKPGSRARRGGSRRSPSSDRCWVVTSSVTARRVWCSSISTPPTSVSRTSACTRTSNEAASKDRSC